MVKRSRDQSQEAPRRFSWLMIVPPDSSFHCPDALDEFLAAERAAVRLLPLHQLALDHHLRGDAGMVGAGLPEHVRPRMRSKRTSMSCSVLLSAWPICSEPVTFGGGMTMAIGPRALAIRAARGKGVGLLPERGRCGPRSHAG